MRRRTTTFVGFALLTVFTLSGCQVGPDFQKPTAPTPDIWQTEASGVTFLQGGVRREVQWWRTLGEPELESIVARLMTDNYSLREAAHRIQEARAQRRATVAQRFPTLSADTGYSYRRFSQNGNAFVPQANATSGFNVISDGFDLSWEVDVWGRVKRLEEAADAEIAREEELLADLRIMLVAEACTTFIEARVLQHRLMIAEANRQLQQQTVDLTASRERAGLSSLLDVHQATTQLRLTESTIPSLDAQLRTAVYRLCTLQGEPPIRDPLSVIGEGPIPAPPMEIYSGIPADLLRNRPDVRAAEEQVHADSAKIGVAEADLYPQLSINGSISVEARNSSDLFVKRSLAHDVGPTLKWNFFQFGKVRASIAAAQMRFEQSLDAYRQTVLEGYEEVETALVEIESNRLESEYLSSAVQESRAAYELAIREYERGILAFQTVLDAERQVLAAQDQWAVVKGDQLAAVVELYRAMGGGWETPAIDVAAGMAQRDRLESPVRIAPVNPAPAPESWQAPHQHDLAFDRVDPTQVVPQDVDNGIVEVARPVAGMGWNQSSIQIVPSQPQRTLRRHERIPDIAQLGESSRRSDAASGSPAWEDLGRSAGTVFAAEPTVNDDSAPSSNPSGVVIEATTPVESVSNGPINPSKPWTRAASASLTTPETQSILNRSNAMNTEPSDPEALNNAPQIDRLPRVETVTPGSTIEVNLPYDNPAGPRGSRVVGHMESHAGDGSGQSISLPVYLPFTPRSSESFDIERREADFGRAPQIPELNPETFQANRHPRAILERLPAVESIPQQGQVQRGGLPSSPPATYPAGAPWRSMNPQPSPIIAPPTWSEQHSAPQRTRTPSPSISADQGLETDDYWRAVSIPPMRLHTRNDAPSWPIEPQGIPSIPFLNPVGSGLTPQAPVIHRFPPMIERLPRAAEPSENLERLPSF